VAAEPEVPVSGKQALEAAGLAKVVVVYTDEHGIMRTGSYVMARESLTEVLSQISEKAAA